MTSKGAVLREKRRARRVREILEAALEVFNEKGYHKATMEEIAERALLTRVALYKYFRDKLTILKALLEWKLDELTEAVETALARSPDFPGKIRQIIRETLTFQENNRGFFRALITASVLPDLIQDRTLYRLIQRYIELVTRVIEEGIQRGEVHPAPADELAELLASMVFKATAKWNLDPDHASAPADHPELIEQIFLRGVLRST
ncbi:TetR/AcrR family transcriptional regulator [Marinithermus hydrothermalis]|uniref:Regulatory protein TetR n=1 Tax=Marinithermus hydrothermalis (strain DSM 14884 / JCM 11576 / T1) TaxID=869210 RepID=F2NPP7_MARHT|nr:TetR/AcrR family transcriptional regulator [Marinithermus hydrothermalis]AEB12823.1 regulatory protein TetR [Marinithermus hydrothermalis DSM 14884]